MAAIEKMANPKVVVAVGATDTEGSVGQARMKNLLLGRGKRTIYPVDPTREPGLYDKEERRERRSRTKPQMTNGPSWLP